MKFVLNNMRGFTPTPKRVSSHRPQQWVWGFTLVEIIIVLAVITSGLLGALTLLSATQASFAVARDELTAAGLAQEGIELVRARRDSNWIARRVWTDGILGTGSCADIDNPTLFSCSGTIYFDSGRGVFVHTPGAPTAFSRLLAVSSVSPNELRILSTVSWQRRGTPFSLSVEEHLFNWK